MVIIAAPLDFYRFIPDIFCIEKVANPKSVKPACFKLRFDGTYHRRIRIFTGEGAYGAGRVGRAP